MYTRMRCIDGSRQGEVVRVHERRRLKDVIFLSKPRKPLTASDFESFRMPPAIESIEDLTEAYYIHEGFKNRSRFKFLSILSEMDDDYLNFKLQTSRSN